jgi:hypothetical protein
MAEPDPVISVVARVRPRDESEQGSLATGPGDSAEAVQSELISRPAAVAGRRNWMILGSDRGGETAAILMSILAMFRASCPPPPVYSSTSSS